MLLCVCLRERERERGEKLISTMLECVCVCLVSFRRESFVGGFIALFVCD